jgi:hypothetical protein
MLVEALWRDSMEVVVLVDIVLMCGEIRQREYETYTSLLLEP